MRTGVEHGSAWPLTLALVGLMAGASAPVLAEELSLRQQADGSHVLSNDPPAAVRLLPPPAGAQDGTFDKLVVYHAQRHGLDPRLVRAVIAVESAFDPAARSRKGAIGLMQLMPATASELGVKNAWDPGENVSGGTRYLRYLLDRFGGNLELALAAYNAGPTAVEKYGRVPPFRETINFVKKVLRLFRAGGPFILPERGSGSPAVLVRRDAEGGILLVTAN